MRRHLNSSIAKLDAAYRVIPGTPMPKQAKQLALRIDPFKPCTATVFWWRQPKAKGGYRQLCRLPTVLKAASVMVKDVLEACLIPAPHLFDIKGRGRDLEAQRIGEAIEQGYEWCFLADVRSCFDSVQLDALGQLPLPETVIRNVLDSRTMVLRHSTHSERRYAEKHRVSYGDHDTPGRNGPRGLMQGSPASNAIIAWFFNDLPNVIRHDCRLFVLADDLLVAAKSEAACREIETTLTGYFDGHHAGPFVLLGRITSIAEGFERAGYAFRRDPVHQGVVIEPSGRNYDKLAEATEAGLRLDKQAGRVEPIAGARALNERLSGFPAMSNLENFRDGSIDGMREELRERHPAAAEATDQLDVLFDRLPRGVRESLVVRLNKSLSNPAADDRAR